MVYAIWLKRYTNQKIRFCCKDSFPLLNCSGLTWATKFRFLCSRFFYIHGQRRALQLVYTIYSDNQTILKIDERFVKDGSGAIELDEFIQMMANRISGMQIYLMLNGFRTRKLRHNCRLRFFFLLQNNKNDYLSENVSFFIIFRNISFITSIGLEL